MAIQIQHKFTSMRTLILIVAVFAHGAVAWDNDELEIFDLIEEVNQNFYEFLGIDPKASSSEVKKAYRKLSLVLHPDRNDAEDADVKFRQLAGIYDTLRDEQKREIYDRVLVEGLPDWRMPVFYYRRMRKMGLAEGIAYLFVIVTICQYCINWAAYWEKKFTLSENINVHVKKAIKKSKKSGASGAQLDEQVQAIREAEAEILGAKPTCFDTLPFQIFRLIKYTIFVVPTLPATMYQMYKDEKKKKEEEERLAKEEEEERIRREEEKKERKEQRKQRKNVNQYREYAGGDNSSDSERPSSVNEDVYNRPKNATQMWTDDDLSKLAKLMKKFPGGTMDRWEKIAEILERYPWEVTKMAQKVKNMGFMVSGNSIRNTGELKNKCMYRQMLFVVFYDMCVINVHFLRSRCKLHRKV